jgi:hypothetical protein
MEEVLDGHVPNNLFELYSQCTAPDPQAQLQRLMGNEEYKAEQVTEMVEWLNTALGLHPCHVGRFWFSNTLQRTRWEQLQVIEPYFTDEVLGTQLLPLIHKQAATQAASTTTGSTQKRVSLRVLDWLVTNFSKKNRIIYTLNTPTGQAVPFNLYVQYKASLNRYKRHVFDPFRRHKRVYFIFQNAMYSTTVGQLNFMHWAFEHQIIQYAQSRMAEIEADMTQCIKENQHDKELYKKRGTKRSRKPLCNIAPRKCFVYSMEESVVFVQAPVKRK